MCLPWSRRAGGSPYGISAHPAHPVGWVLSLVGGGLCILMGLGAFLVPTIVTLEQQAGAALEPEPAGRP